MDDRPDPPTFGVLPDQQYSDRQVTKIVREALPAALADRSLEVGKVTCPCCRLLEARWRRHFEDEGGIRWFIYCTQCHKTGVREMSAAEVARCEKRGCAGLLILWIVALGAMGG